MFDNEISTHVRHVGSIVTCVRHVGSIVTCVRHVGQVPQPQIAVYLRAPACWRWVVAVASVKKIRLCLIRLG